MRQEIIDLEPYEPIEPLDVISRRVGIPVEKLVKLDGNENLYGCSPRVQRALADFKAYHIYPDPLNRDLRKTIEKYVGIGMEHIVAGSGSDELIDLVLRLFLRPGEKVINCPPTFGMYPFCTRICGGQTVSVPRDSSYDLDVAAVRSAIDDRTRVIFVTSPNNPTGNVALRKVIEELLGTGLIVVVDEAYYEFCGVTVAPLVAEHPNLVVLRTFSKWAGLAGLRVGYGIFPVKMADMLGKMKQPYNVNVAAQIAVRESLADLEYLQKNVKAIVAERSRLHARLEAQGVLKPIPSQANFILCRVPAGLDALKMKKGLEEKGVFIRYYNTPLLKNMVRPSVGKPEHTDALIAALEKYKSG